ncbi:MAG: beta-propeller fold lactonase family protein [Nitrosomonas halophila]
MNRNIAGFKDSIATLMALLLFAVALLASPMVLAAVHHIALTAETLPNGQLAYKLANSEQAVIPGPTIFVKRGDRVNVTLTNNTAVPVGFSIPGRPLLGAAAKALPGTSRNYSFTASTVGAFLYHGDNGKERLGLFGALIVDNKDPRPLDHYVDDDGAIIPVTQDNLDKQYVLFMVDSTFWGTEISADGATQRPLWANPTPGAVLGEIVRFHVLSIGPGHTFHIHAHRWLKEGTDKVIDTRILTDGFDTHSFTVKAGSGVGAGDWQFHCHLIAHMEAGMHGNFKVVEAGGDGSAIVGASPYGRILLGPEDVPGVVTFEVSDEPASWFRSARGDAIVGLPFDIKTKSLEVIAPGSSVNFTMSDTNAVHTISSLLWPSGAEHMPFDQSAAYKGGGFVTLHTPGLYVFTCKVHPYMFGAVIVDDPSTEGLDLGNPAQDYTIDLVTGIRNLPTNSDLAIRLLTTFFVATAPDNWQDYSSGVWNVTFPNLPVRISGAPRSETLTEGGVAAPLSILNVVNAALPAPNPPAISGVGEVWVNAQFEKTANKTKPGTITVLDAGDWKVKRKIALPAINMNNPHNLWPSNDQSKIYQTQWFDTKLTVINRETGAMLHNIKVGETPSHVLTLPTNDQIVVAINGQNGLAMIDAGASEVNRITPTQPHGHKSAHPHGHWVSADGTRIVTPNINTDDVGIYSADGAIQSRTATGNNLPGAHPIAIGMMPDDSKIYASNLLHHTVSVVNGHTGDLVKTIDLIENYHPITGEIDGPVGVLPIQIPVSPDGKAVVVANTGGQIIVIDTETDTIVKMFECDPGCHGANFGAKAGGGYYAYVTSKFSNRMFVVDIDPNGDGNIEDVAIAGTVSLVADDETLRDDGIVGMAGMGGQGVLAIPNVYNGWVQKLPSNFKESLAAAQLNPVQ